MKQTILDGIFLFLVPIGIVTVPVALDLSVAAHCLSLVLVVLEVFLYARWAVRQIGKGFGND